MALMGNSSLSRNQVDTFTAVYGLPSNETP